MGAVTDDEIRAEVNAMIASGENGEGAAIESDYLWAAFDKWFDAIGRGFLPPMFSHQSVQELRRKLGAAFEAGWDASRDDLKGKEDA